ncbi:MAG: hypothetical protein QS98_C0003G0033 [archaeon GW2011_AR3]|nr:MAG: hypothetical protein QS98_C0003G0033 [archaeon GW2011_AR3]MBS3110075.1 queuosine precursor transporter [Candidatus Woesearchaeota archaeon]
MQNELLFAAEIIASFLLIILAYKLFGKIGLYVWTAMAVLLANLQVYKTIEIFGMVTALGNVIYSSTFLVTDILEEKHKVRDAQKAVWIGFFVLITTTLLMQLALMFIAHESDQTGSHLQALFQLFPRIAFASLTAYFISQFHDVWVFNTMRNLTNGKYLWLRNNVSTILSQLIDNTTFTLIAFWGVLEWQIIWEIWLTSIILKIIISISDTPFLYWAKRMKKVGILS